MAGKNKVLRWARAYVGGYDLSGDARTFAGLDNHFGEADMSAWSDSLHWFLSDGQRVVGIRGFQAFLDDAAAGALAILKQATSTTRQVTIAFGSGAEPTLGDPVYLLAGAQYQDKQDVDTNKPVINADFMPDPAQYSASAANPIGVLLSGAVSLSATTTGASFDEGAATTAGGHANLHVLASSGGTWSLKIQHSSDNSSFADLITFTANGSAVTSEHKAVAGTINRYTRVLLTRTGGTVTPVIAFARS